MKSSHNLKDDSNFNPRFIPSLKFRLIDMDECFITFFVISAIKKNGGFLCIYKIVASSDCRM